MRKIEEIIAGMKFKSKAEEVAFVFGWTAAMSEMNEDIEKKKKGKEVETVSDLIKVLKVMPKKKVLRMNVATSYDDYGLNYEWKKVEVVNVTDGVVLMERETK